MAVRWLLIAVVGLAASEVSCQAGIAPFGDPPPLPTKGVRLYQGIFHRAIPNYVMIAARDFVDRDGGSEGHGNASRHDGLNDGLWCQSAANVNGIGSWKLPNGSVAPDDLNAEPIHMANRPGQVGLLRYGSIARSPYQGMYICTIPDENGVNQTLVVWAASNAAYNGTSRNFTPNPVVTDESFIPSPKPRDIDPPEVILSFNVSVAPPTYVTCQVGSTPVDVAVLSREVTVGEYIPPSAESLVKNITMTNVTVTNVTVTLRTREPGNYQCNVSVFRASGSNLTNAATSPIRISVTDKPTNVRSELTGEYAVKLSWSAPASNIPPVAGYEVFYAASGNSSTQSGGTTTANTTTINVTLPHLSSVYDFFVVAFSDADNALPSAHSSNITVDLKQLGPCQAAGYHNCCQAACLGDSDELCYCDAGCFTFDDCCSDIHEIGCYEAVPPTEDTEPPLGPCQTAGYHNCCQAACLGDSDELCYCDVGCFIFDDCCSDIHEIGCYEVVQPTEATEPPLGPCQAAGYHSCCQENFCYGNSTTPCHCDNRCFMYDDCCSDIYEIGCYVENETNCSLVHCPPPPCPNPIPADFANGKCCASCPEGSCKAAGYDGCCQFGSCYGNTTDCLCDQKCFLLDDCCSDIHEIGCYNATDAPPTNDTRPFPGSCKAVGYDGCCRSGSCYGNATDCFCDEKCFLLGDCCLDIHEIGCNETAPPTEDGPCQAAGYHNCCQEGFCYGNSTTPCYCDNRCFTFRDCCSDIYEIGCYVENKTDCSLVHCPPPPCPNPIPADFANGKCCPSCPDVVPPTDVTTPPYGNDSRVDLNCGPVCMLAELSCLCEVNNADLLTWKLIDVYNNQVGGTTFVKGFHPVGATVTFAGGHFVAIVTNVTEKMLTSTVTGTVSQTTDGYTLQCIDVSTLDSVSAEISILDVPSQPENLTATTDTTSCSVLLSWTPPINSSQCVVGYIITSTLPNSTVSISTTLNHTLFADGSATPSCTYTASVAANDTAGRIGNWSHVLFSFEGSSPPMSESHCPVAGQVFQSCASLCKATCSDPFPLCKKPCRPGYGCPSGHVVDQQKNRCVPLDSCPATDVCQQPAKAGNCRARIKRYYYNADAGQCQSFIYSGCNGNDNNFKSVNKCRKQCHKEAIDCSTVKCQVPTCPDPIPPNPAEGECCSKCPPCSTCPIKGQVYHECMGCPPTCDNYDKLVPCPAICSPGCACPHGTVFDERRNTCVYPEQCLGKCELDPEVGTCKGTLPRYFYNATSKQCEKFIYSSCGGNENNFETLLNCEKNCSECAPTCTPDFCKGKLQAKCNISPSEDTHSTDSCFGDCDETVCSACYYSNETLSMPTLDEDCPTLCPVDAKGEIFGMTCLRKWGKCVRSANLATYGKPSKEMKSAENFKCWRPSCPSYG